MIDPYRMILVNLIAFFSLILFLGFWAYILKRKINALILVILFSLLPLISVLRKGVYESGDFTVNIYKAMSFYSNLIEGNLIPHWAGILNATYGYPQFIFMYPLPFYAISVFHFMGFTFIFSLKLVIISTFILSGIGMYLWVREEISKKAGLVSAIFYLYAPYHLVDMHFRISIGELFSFAILPFCFLYIYKLINKPSANNLYILTIFLSLLILSNHAIALTGFILLFSYLFFEWLRVSKKGKGLLFFICPFLISLLITSFYWIPVINSSKFTHQSYFIKSIDFLNIKELLVSKWAFGLLFQGPKGELSFLIGYAQILVIIIVVIYLIQKKFPFRSVYKIKYFLISLLMISFLALSYSAFIWTNIEILRNFQFTSRLLLFISILTAYLAGTLTLLNKNKLLIALIALAISQTILNWGNRRVLPEINDQALLANLPYSTSQGEGFQPASPKWTNINEMWINKVPVNKTKKLNGSASIKEIKNNNTNHEYLIQADKHTLIRENTLFFVGWDAYLNNKKTKIVPDKDGIINIKIPPGLHKLMIVYEKTEIMKITKIISIFSISIFTLFYLFYKVKNIKHDHISSPKF